MFLYTTKKHTLQNGQMERALVIDSRLHSWVYQHRSGWWVTFEFANPDFYGLVP